MSSDEEVEKFEVTENDLKDAFFPGFRRKFTKEQAIYGMWATDEESGRRGLGGGNRPKGDYSSPMDFVSGGFTQKQDDDSDDSSNDGQPGTFYQNFASHHKCFTACRVCKHTRLLPNFINQMFEQGISFLPFCFNLSCSLQKYCCRGEMQLFCEFMEPFAFLSVSSLLQFFCSFSKPFIFHFF